MKDNIVLFLMFLGWSAVLTLNGWNNYTGRTPPEHGGNKASGIGYFISCIFTLIGAFTFLIGVTNIGLVALIIGMVVGIVSGMFHNFQFYKTNR